jgi:hypothetical protein
MPGGRNGRSTIEPRPSSPRRSQQNDDRVVVLLPQLRNHGEGPTYRGLTFPTGFACGGSIEEDLRFPLPWRAAWSASKHHTDKIIGSNVGSNKVLRIYTLQLCL